MDELVNYLKSGAYLHQFPGDYGHVTAIIYNAISYALRDNAEQLRLDSKYLASMRQGKDIIKMRVDEPKPTVSYYDQFLMIVEQDETVRRYTRIVRKTDDEIVIAFVGDNTFRKES